MLRKALWAVVALAFMLTPAPHLAQASSAVRLLVTAKPLDPATVALVAAMTVKPSSARVQVINSAIVQLKSAGIWTRADAIYFTAAHAEQASRLNWVSPATITLTAVNSPTFTVDRGWRGDGVSAYLTLGVLRSALVKYTQNDAHIATWNVREFSGAASRYTMGGDSNNTLRINSRTNTDNVGGRINDITSLSSSPVTTAILNTGLNRVAGPTKTLYVNGAAAGSAATVSAAVSGTIYLLRDGTAYSGEDMIAFASVGASLTAVQWAAYYNITRQYLAAVGAL